MGQGCRDPAWPYLKRSGRTPSAAHEPGVNPRAAGSMGEQRPTQEEEGKVKYNPLANITQWNYSWSALGTPPSSHG